MSNPLGRSGAAIVKEEPGLERANPPVPKEPPLSEMGMKRKIKEQAAYIEILEADQAYNESIRQDWRKVKVEMQCRNTSLEEQLESVMQIPEILRQTKHMTEMLERILDPAQDHKRPRRE